MFKVISWNQIADYACLLNRASMWKHTGSTYDTAQSWTHCPSHVSKGYSSMKAENCDDFCVN